MIDREYIEAVAYIGNSSKKMGLPVRDEEIAAIALADMQPIALQMLIEAHPDAKTCLELYLRYMDGGGARDEAQNIAQDLAAIAPGPINQLRAYEMSTRQPPRHEPEVEEARKKRGQHHV